MSVAKNTKWFASHTKHVTQHLKNYQKVIDPPKKKTTTVKKKCNASAADVFQLFSIVLLFRLLDYVQQFYQPCTQSSVQRYHRPSRSQVRMGQFFESASPCTIYSKQETR
jgi:hypothetical protein